jgi:DnaJ-class molecular chaperone
MDPLKKPLVFGDKNQIEALRMRDRQDLCERCDGEGNLTCPGCGGTGVVRKFRNIEDNKGETI